MTPEQMREHAEREVATWPPMTDEQIARAVVLARPLEDEQVAS